MKEIVSTCVEHFRSSISCAFGPVPPFGALQAVLQLLERTLGPDTPEVRLRATDGSHSIERILIIPLFVHINLYITIKCPPLFLERKKHCRTKSEPF